MSRKIKKVVPNIFLPSFSFVGFIDITKASLSSQKLPPNAISEIIITRDDIEKKASFIKLKIFLIKKTK